MSDPLKLADEYIEHQDCSIDTCPFIQGHHASTFSDAVELASAIRELHGRYLGVKDQVETWRSAWYRDAHVIAAENVRLKEELENPSAEQVHHWQTEALEKIARLKEENRKKDEALEFYAQRSNHVGLLAGLISRSAVEEDFGAMARAALSPTPETEKP